MLRIGKDELICDLAETYHIFDYRALRPSMLATLAVGLRDNSRIKMKIIGERVDINTQLLAAIVDRLSILIWQKTEDGHKGRNRPVSILESFSKPKEDFGFDTIDEFEAERKRILCLN